MKKSVFLLLIIAMGVMLPANAELTVSDIASHEYLINHGHSEPGAEAVARARAQANAVPYEAIKEETVWDTNGFLNFWKRVYTYLDPAADQDTFMNHDIRVTPGVHDL